jgi:hypothetical protein
MKLINSLTSNMTQGVKFHRIEANTVYRLATGEIIWDTLNENEKRSIAWNPDFAKAIDNSSANIVPVIAFNRFIDYIRKMAEDLGYLILKNISRTGMPIDEICEAVERSNHLKKKARIVEGTRTRVEPDQAELLLKSGELILCIVGLYHLIKGWKGPSSPINFSDVRLVLPA